MKKNEVLLRVSNRHMHMTQKTLETLFGEGYELHVKKSLDPPIFASEETVILEGPRGRIEGVRILGPCRPYDQVELLLSDNFKLGINAPILLSGSEDKAPLKVIGPAGEIDFDKVAIVAKRHIHFTEEQAADFGVEKGQNVRVRVGSGDRKLIFDDVAVVITAGMPEPSLDLDFEETNAAASKAGDYVEVLFD